MNTDDTPEVTRGALTLLSTQRELLKDHSRSISKEEMDSAARSFVEEMAVDVANLIGQIGAKRQPISEVIEFYRNTLNSEHFQIWQERVLPILMKSRKGEST